MPQRSFDDPELRAAMSAYLDAARALEAASQDEAQERQVVELADATAMAAMQLRKRLEALGWTAPAGQRSAT